MDTVMNLAPGEELSLPPSRPLMPSRSLMTLSDHLIDHEHTDVESQRDGPTHLQEDTHTLCSTQMTQENAPGRTESAKTAPQVTCTSILQFSELRHASTTILVSSFKSCSALSPTHSWGRPQASVMREACTRACFHAHTLLHSCTCEQLI